MYQDLFKHIIMSWLEEIKIVNIFFLNPMISKYNSTLAVVSSYQCSNYQCFKVKVYKHYTQSYQAIFLLSLFYYKVYYEENQTYLSVLI